MTKDDQETEVKFYVENITKIKECLQSLEARLIQTRTHELNLRFDTRERDFYREGRVLRLRQDDEVRLTYKDRTSLKEGILSRREIEFSVNDFESARQFLEALGFEISFIYEKYRTTYGLPVYSSDIKQSLENYIMLDELPYGDFVEIEGEFKELKPLALRLGLNWDAAIPASYHSLFDRVFKSRNLPFRDLTFDNFDHLQINKFDLGVEAADR